MQMKMFFSKKLFMISGILFFTFQVAILVILYNAAPVMEVLRQQTTLSSDEFLALSTKWGAENMHIFLSHYYLDFFHPLFYAVFLSCCIDWAWSKNYQAWLLIFPFVTAIADEIENFCQLSINLKWVDLNSIWFYLGAGSSRIKWFFAGITLVAIAIGLFKKEISKSKTDYYY